MLCDRCGKNPPVIHITGEGSYCADCNNQLMLEMFGKDNTFHYAKNIIISETDGKMHSFRIQHLILGGIVSWEAQEVGGNYHFEDVSDLNDNGSDIAQRFFRKIMNGVLYKSIEKEVSPASNLLSRGGLCYSLKEHGNISIEEDPESGYESIRFRIDDEFFTPEEAARMLSSYVGWNMKYQIESTSEAYLGEDEYLVPVKVNRRIILGKWNMLRELYLREGYLREDDQIDFDEGMQEIIEKLIILREHGNMDIAIEAGEQIIEELQHFTGPGEDFPFLDIDILSGVIHKYR